VSAAEDNEQAQLLQRFGLGDEDLAVWRARGPSGREEFEEWLADRVARCPEGARARAVYGAEDVHDFARRAILDALSLTPGEHLLEIGCGGGLLLRDALAAGAQATGIDHSNDMVELARERAPGAYVLLAEADRLPFESGYFDAVALAVVFFMFDNPVAVLDECRRVLRAGGRLAIYTTAPELRGTPAAPEPLASHSRFYTDIELAELAGRAQLHEVTVRNDDGGQLLYAKA